VGETRLDEIEPSDSLAVLVQGSAAPVFRGTNPDGDSYLCGACESHVLAESVREGDLYDLAFRCGACGGLSIGPRLPAGRPLPWQTTVVVDPGQYLIGGTVEGRDGVVLAGREAVNSALFEIGAGSGGSGASKELGFEYLESLVAKVKALLGGSYDAMKTSYERGRKSKTPPKVPHRLVELLDAAETAAESFRSGQPALDPVATVELDVLVSQLERWSRHPLWPSLLPSLASPQDFPHLVLIFAAASFLSDVGNAVELVAVGGERTPDLRLHLTARSVVGTELKSPLALQRPQAPLDTETASAIVRKAMKRAGSGAKGQLRSKNDAVLVIGGFSLRDSDLDALEAAARELLQHHRDKRTHLLAIAVVSLGVLLDARQMGIGRSLPTLSGTITARVVRNEQYAGDATLQEGERPELHPVEGPLEEVDVADLDNRSWRNSTVRKPRDKLGRNDPCWCGSGAKFKKCHGR
jgi:SEC-C motif